MSNRTFFYESVAADKVKAQEECKCTEKVLHACSYRYDGNVNKNNIPKIIETLFII